jgi:hypothetical protein
MSDRYDIAALSATEAAASAKCDLTISAFEIDTRSRPSYAK